MLKDASHNELWTRLREGDKDVLLDFYNKYYLDFMNYGLRLTGDRVLTNDCITQFLLRLWDKREFLPVILNHRAYLLTCLRHEIYASLKSENTRIARSEAIQRFYGTEERSYEEVLIELQTNKSLKDKLERALRQLTEREKELLRLKFFEDLDYDEIAARCRITKRTAYNIIHTALKTLKTKFVIKPDNGVIPDSSFLGLVILLLCHCL